MAELAHFKNFAKLKDTSIEFNDITVLAGKPGTGKSYVMKFMYAIFESIRLSFDLYRDTMLNPALNEKLVNQMIQDGLDKELTKEKIHKILEMIQQTLSQVEYKNYLPADNKADIVFLEIIKNVLISIFSSMNEISESFIVNYKDVALNYSKELLDSKIDFNSILLFENTIFVETPLILEFKKFMNHEKGKTPYHIESLLNVLDTDYSFTDEEQDKFIKSFRETSKAIIGGDIESTGDSFIFNRENDKNYDILNASSGIKSIGLLQYLVTNKALKKGSVLFWEEPEVHLHPSWQLKMVDLFVELMNAGVKIVFSTHSPYMADYLNAISKRNNYRDRISFNVLDEKDGVVTNHILDDDNWNILQKELMDSFEDILWQYL